MNHFLLVFLFLILYGGDTVGLNVSLAPGLSVKNAFLYAIALAIMIDAAVTRSRRLEFVSVLAPLTGYVVFGIFSWLVVLLIIDYPGYSLRDSLFTLKSGLIEHLLVLLIYFYGVTEQRKALWILKGLIWIVIVGNVITVIDGLNVPDLGIIKEENGRVAGPIASLNQFAYLTALFLPATAALYLRESRGLRVMAGIGVAATALTLLMTISRGAIVGLVTACVLSAFLLRSAVPLRVIVRTGLAGLIFAVGSIAVLMFTGYGDMMLERAGLFEGNVRYASSGRTDIWGKAIEKMLQHPLSFVTGYGWRSYETFRDFGTDFQLATHNTYLNILFNLGLIGLAIFVLTAVNIARCTRRAILEADPQRRPFLFAFFIGFLSLLIALMFNDLQTAWLIVWAYVGICLRVGQTALEEKHEGTGAAALARHKGLPVSSAGSMSSVES